MEPSSPIDVSFWGDFDADTVVIGRDDVSDFNAENILPQPEPVLEKIRNWLNPTQYDGDGSEYQTHLSSHLPGTGDWVFTSDVYQQWHDSAEHGILWIRGIPGAGKSVLASSLIHRLLEEHVPVLFFFFRHTIDANNSPEALLRDWLAQVLKFSPPLQRELMEYPQTGVPVQTLSLTDLGGYVRRALMYLPKVYCVVDAMDEMNLDRLEPLLKSLDALGQWRPAEIKLVATSRPVAVVERVFSRGVKTLDVRMDKKHVEGDIMRYIRHRLGTSPVASEHHAEIEQAILQRADGLFLYAKLALDSLLQPGADMRKSLEGMPMDLTDMYTNLLREHSRKTVDIPSGLQELVLQLVTHATRPLRLLEIAELVRVTQDPRDLGIIKDLIRSICGPLLEILPDETVRVVHHSLTEYLKGTNRKFDTDARIFAVFDYGTTNSRLAILCLSYLAAGCLDAVKLEERRQVGGDVNYIEPSRLLPNQVLPPFTQYAGTNWPIHVRRAVSSGNGPTQLNIALDALLTVSNMDKIDALVSTRMAFQPTPLHFAIALELQEYATYLLSTKKSEYLKNGALDDTLILYAAETGSEFMVKLLLDHGPDLKPRNDRGWTPLHLAVVHEHPKVAAILLDAGIDPDVAQGKDNFFSNPYEGGLPWTPAESAFKEGSLDIAMVFYDRLREPMAVTQALRHAIIGHNTEVIRLLTQHPMFDVNLKDGTAPILHMACGNRDVTAIELLLKAGADPNFVVEDPKPPPDPYAAIMPLVSPFPEPSIDEDDTIKSRALSGAIGRNTLHAWASGSNPRRRDGMPKFDQDELARGIRMLLEHGANVRQIGREGNTPLLSARDAVTVSALLDGGADPNALNSRGETLLHTCFDQEVLDVLLPRTDLNVRTVATKRTPLLSRLVDGHDTEQSRVEKALKLLEYGADASVTDCNGNSALHLAVGLRDMDKSGIPLIEKLCAAGADVNLKNHQGKTPLHMNGPGSGRASSLGYDNSYFQPEVFRALIRAGADPNLQDNHGQTPLFQFLEHGQSFDHSRVMDVANQIIQAGCQVRTLDLRGRSLLHSATHGRFGIPLLELLVEQGADPKHADNDGNTLLHEAAPILSKSHSYASVVDMLIQIDVDPKQRNSQGRTALHILSSFTPDAFDPCISTSSGGRATNADNPSGFDYFLDRHRDMVDCADKDGVTPLHIASTFSQYITRRLLDADASISKTTKEGLTPLHLAARSRQVNVVGILLEKLQSHSTPEEIYSIVHAKDQLNRTALYYAAASGYVETFQLLVAAGATVDHDSYEGSPWNGCADFEKELATADWSRRVERQRSWMANIQNVNAGGVLISDTTRPEQAMRHGEDSLFPSERLDEILNLLTSSVSTSEKQGNFIDQAVAFSVKNQYDYTVECLLRARKRLMSDAEYDVDEETQACLSRRQDDRASRSPEDDRDSIIRLMRSRDYERVSEKLDTLNNIEIITTGGVKSILHELVHGGFDSLVSKAASENAISKVEWHEYQNTGGDGVTYTAFSEGTPLLTTACQRHVPNMDVIRVLVEQKQVDINGRLSERQHAHPYTPRAGTPLHYLAGGDQWWQSAQAIPYLVSHGADTEAVHPDTRLTPLGSALQAIDGPHFIKRVVETLLELGAKPTCLAWTVKHPKVFQLLVDHGAVITQAALLAAIRQEDVALVETILDNGADPNMRDPPDRYGRQGLYPIDWMSSRMDQQEHVRESDSRIFKLLLDHGADPFARYKDSTALHQIMKYRSFQHYPSGTHDFLDVLLGQPGLDLETPDSNGMTLLLQACSRGFGTEKGQEDVALKVIRKLLDLGADVCARDNDGRSALHHVCPFRRRLEFILATAPALLDAADNQGETPLQYALARRHVDIIYADRVSSILIAAGADVAHASHNGKTPLHIVLKSADWTIKMDGSVAGSHRETFDSLVARGADLNARNSLGETPLAMLFRNATVKAEVEDDDDIDGSSGGHSGRRNSLQRKKYQLERQNGVAREHILWEFLERHGADWHTVNEAGEGLLHIIAQDTTNEKQSSWHGRRVARFKFLMEKGLDPTMEDKEHRTPLDLAAALGLDDLLGLFKREE